MVVGNTTLSTAGAMPTMDDRTTEAGAAADIPTPGGSPPPSTPPLADDGLRSTAGPRTVAAPAYDSERCAGPTGTRALARWRRRLLYRAGRVEVDLQVGRSKIAGRLRLLGQVTTGEPSVSPIEVTVDGPSGHLTRETDDTGLFMLDRLVAGDHHLSIGLVNEVIEIPGVPLRPRFPLAHDDLVTTLGLSIPPRQRDTRSD